VRPITLTTAAEAAMSRAAQACRGHKSAKVIAQTEHTTLKNHIAPSVVTVVVIRIGFTLRLTYRRREGSGSAIRRYKSGRSCERKAGLAVRCRR